MMSIGNQTTFNNLSSIRIPNSNSNLKSFLQQSSNSHLNFPKQISINPLKTQQKLKSCRIKASSATVEAEPVYVNTQSTLYELLGISETGTLSEIKNAYRQLARKYHPDVSPANRTEEYTKRFLEVQEAYETLSDPESRASYDKDMARALFNGRKRDHVGFMDREEWEDRWQSQLEELIRSSNDEPERISWGARMRSKRSSN